MTLVEVLNFTGVVTGAMRATLAVTLRGADLIAALLLATVASIGGGTLRDLLLGEPIFWLRDQSYLIACFVPATLIWATGLGQSRRRFNLLEIADAIGLGAWAVVGCLKAQQAGLPWLTAAAIGALAATWGGLMRELLVGEPTVLVRKEVYVTAALFAGATFLLGRAAGLQTTPAALLGTAAGAGLRLLAIWRAFEMPPAPWLRPVERDRPPNGADGSAHP